MAAVTFRAGGTKKQTSLGSAFSECASGPNRKERSKEYRGVSQELRDTVRDHLKVRYEEVAAEIFEFIASLDGVLIPAAVVRCGYVDSTQLRDAIQDPERSDHLFHVISPSTASAPVSECVGDVVALFNELHEKSQTEFYGALEDVEAGNASLSEDLRNRKIVILFEKVESIAPAFLSTFVSLLTTRKVPIAFIFCATADLNIVRVRCTRDSCAAMAFKKFNFGRSEEILSNLLCKTFLSDKMNMELDVKLLEIVCWRFTHLNYSFDDLLHCLDLAVLFHFADSPSSGDVEQIARSRPFLKKYWALINLLYSLISSTPSCGFESESGEEKTLARLHSSVQSGHFFNDGAINSWKSTWLAYDEAEMKHFLGIVEKFLESTDESLDLHEEIERCKTFITDLNNLESRRRKCEAELKATVAQSPSVHRSRHEMQKDLLQRKELSNRLNVFRRDKMVIVSWVEKLFEINLRPFSRFEGHEAFLVKYSERWESCIDFSMDKYIHLALNPQEIENLTDEERHLPVVYRTVLNWAQASKHIKVEKCLKDFLTQTSSDRENSECTDLFRRCLAELELFGLVKPLSDHFGMSGSASESESDSRSQASSHPSSRRASITDEEEVDQVEMQEEQDESHPALEMARLNPAAAKAREEEQAQFYTPAAQHRAVTNLVFYSIMMFLFPLGVMFGSYHVIFIDYFGYDTQTASLYAGITAAVAVYIVIVAFIFTAYCEESEAEKQKLEKKNE